MSDADVGVGRFAGSAQGVTVDGGMIHGTTDFGADGTAWEERRGKRKRCPGPGHGYPPCGQLITNYATRCRRCAVLWQELERGPDPAVAIRERPRESVDPLEYLERLRAEIRARKGEHAGAAEG